MFKIDKIIVVEGKYDKIRLSSFIDAVIVETDGFGIFKDKQKQRFLRKIASEKGIVVLTDSDSAGFLIRSFISSVVPVEFITNVYIPDVSGKEKRKVVPSKEGKLGVEGIDNDVILEAFKKSGISFEENTSETLSERQITFFDLYEDGICGSMNSSLKKKAFLKLLDLPERISNKSLLKLLNSFITYDDYKTIIGRMNNNV